MLCVDMNSEGVPVSPSPSANQMSVLSEKGSKLTKGSNNRPHWDRAGQ